MSNKLLFENKIFRRNCEYRRDITGWLAMKSALSNERVCYLQRTTGTRCEMTQWPLTFQPSRWQEKMAKYIQRWEEKDLVFKAFVQ